MWHANEHISLIALNSLRVRLGTFSVRLGTLSVRLGTLSVRLGTLLSEFVLSFAPGQTLEVRSPWLRA